MVQELITAGADIIKIGIGSGSVCTTRLKTGIGFPQLSAIIECGQMAHALGGHIISVSCRMPIQQKTTFCLPTGRRMHLSGGCCESICCWGGFRHVGRLIRRTRSMWWRFN